MLTQCQIGDPSIGQPDGDYVVPLAGRTGAPRTASLHGKYFTQCYRKNVFIGNAVNGGSGLYLDSTSIHFGLWNPTGSGKNLVPLKVQFGLASTSVSSTIAYYALSYTKAAGAQVSSSSSGGVSFSTWNTTAPICAYLGANAVSAAQFSVSIGFNNGNPAFLKSLGSNAFFGTSPVAANSYWQLTEYYDGELIVGPGTAIFLESQTVNGGTWNLSMMWEEVPI